MVAQGVVDGYLQAGEPLPSSRALASALGLSRTTVSLALQARTDQGFLNAKPRSGYFVAIASPTRVALPFSVAKDDTPNDPDDIWQHRLQLTPSKQRNIEKPDDWYQMPYPFVYGQFDATGFPYRNWRRCVAETMEARAVRSWAPDHLDQDAPDLIEQIHSRLLPARGVWVERDQILVTSGAQQGLFLLTQLLVGHNTHVGLESPGYPDARNNFMLRTGNLHHLDVDEQGLVMNHKVSGCDYVYVTPSHQCPTTVTLSPQRRIELLERARLDDFVVIEDDHESELNFSSHPTPALKSADSQQRVIYLGSLSKTLAHGLRLGYIVASAPLIKELRALRRLVMRHIPYNNQQAAANFIAHGFHEAHVRNLIETYRERATVLRKALGTFAPQLQLRASRGGSALWASGPEGLDTTLLAKDLYRHGVVVEPGAIFHPDPHAPCAAMRVGYSSIAKDHIEAGVKVLALVLKQHLAVITRRY